LIEDHHQINGAQADDDLPDTSELAVEAKHHQGDRNNPELPDPKPFAVEGHNGTYDRVCLQPRQLEDHHREEGIENIQTKNQYKKEEKLGAVTINVPTLEAILFAANRLSTAEEGVAAEARGGFFSPIR